LIRPLLRACKQCDANICIHRWEVVLL